MPAPNAGRRTGTQEKPSPQGGGFFRRDDAAARDGDWPGRSPRSC